MDWQWCTFMEYTWRDRAKSAHTKKKHTRIHTRTHTHTHTHTHTPHTHTHTHKHAHTHTHTHTHIYVYHACLIALRGVRRLSLHDLFCFEIYIYIYNCNERPL